jgi:hypothetical protein
LPGWGLSVALVYLLSLCIIADVIALSIAAAALALWEPEHLRRPLNTGAPVVITPWEISPIGWLSRLVLVPTAIVFSVWMYRSYRNLQDMGVAELHYAPELAGASHFIMILNLFLPFLITQEMWKASAVDTLKLDSPGWREGRGSWLVRTWWAFSVLAGVFCLMWFCAAIVSLDESSRKATDAARSIGLVAYPLSILATLCALSLVCRLRARQVRKLESLHSTAQEA